MPRNKYPEVTVSRVLEVSLKLFCEKGYDQVKMQDIVEQLNGLTKGAVYHHFKNKEDILDALIDQYSNNFKPFEEVKHDTSLNGLEKIRKVVLRCLETDFNVGILKTTGTVLKTPRFLSKQLEQSKEFVIPYMQELIEEGNKDHSLSVRYPKQTAECFILLSNIWMNPVIFPTSSEEFNDKLQQYKTMLEASGLPLIDDEMIKLFNQFISVRYNGWNSA